MTRFDAATAAERRKLFGEAITAHRNRDSAFCTLEAEGNEAREGESGTGENGIEENEADETQIAAWIQFADGTLNLDCTEAELDRLKDLLGEFPAFKIDELNRPEEVEGVNVRVSALADANRIAEFVDRAFRTVYERPEGYRAWVTEV